MYDARHRAVVWSPYVIPIPNESKQDIHKSADQTVWRVHLNYSKDMECSEQVQISYSAA